jgi:hypothetical protein
MTINYNLHNTDSGEKISTFDFFVTATKKPNQKKNHPFTVVNIVVGVVVERNHQHNSTLEHVR